MKKIIMFLIVILCLSGCKTNKKYDDVVNELKTTKQSDENESVISDTNNAKHNFKENYYYVCNQILYCFDKNQEVSIPLCSKLNCSHEDSSCDAFAPSEFNREGPCYCLDHSVYVYNGYIYMIEREDNKDNLVRYDMSFNNKEIISVLTEGVYTKIGFSENAGNMFEFKDNKLYYMAMEVDLDMNYAAKNNMGNVKCNRFDLNTGEKEELGEFAFPMDYGIMSAESAGKVQIVDNDIYFIGCGNSRMVASDNAIQIKVCRYSEENKQFEVLESVVQERNTTIWNDSGIPTEFNDNICIYKDCIYTILSEGDYKKLVSKSFSSGEISVLYKGDGDLSNLCVYNDKMYFYDNNAMKIIMYDSGALECAYQFICDTKYDQATIGRYSYGGIKIEGIYENNLVISTNRIAIKGFWDYNPKTRKKMNYKLGEKGTYAVAVIVDNEPVVMYSYGD